MLGNQLGVAKDLQNEKKKYTLICTYNKYTLLILFLKTIIHDLRNSAQHCLLTIKIKS